MAYAEDPKLQQILTTMQMHFPVHKAYLFGSRVKGTDHDDSDYDLLVVIKNSSLSRMDREILARQKIGRIGVAVDIFVYTIEEFNDWKGEISSIPETALNEGLELNVV